MINIIFTVVILVLAMIDIATTRSPNHKDFKAIIMIIGVLGTFIGVFIGLLDFDINNIEQSIPFLLDGLKVAFYTSIVGMSAAIIISIYQRFIGLKIDNKGNLDYITIQAKKLDKLDEISSLVKINNEMKDVLSDIAESMRNISNTNASHFELLSIQNTMLENILNATNSHNDKLLTLIESSANNILDSNINNANLLLNELKANADSNFQSLQSSQEKLLQMIDENINTNVKKLLDESKESLDFYNKYSKNLLNAMQININKLVDSININAKNSLDSINSNVNLLLNELNNGFSANIKSLESTQQSLNDNLTKQMQNLLFVVKKEMEKLSIDFSADVICGVDNLAKTFTSTIEVHFSENFERFNKAVDNLLVWQTEHKNIIVDSNEILAHTSASLEKIEMIANSIIKRDEKTIEVYKEVALIMQEYKTQNAALYEKLEVVRDLGDGALAALKFMNTFFNDLNNYVKTTNENLIDNTKKIIKNVFLSTIKEFEVINKKVINDINSRDDVMLQYLQNASKYIENINSTMLDNNNVLFQNYQKLNKDLELNVKTISQNTSEMISNINKEGIKHLKNTTKLYFDDIADTQHKILSNMSSQISKNQEMLDSTLLNLVNNYLSSLERISLNTIEAGKELHISNIEHIKSLNDEVANYIKENALNLNKSNVELLNILEILQNQVEIVLNKTNDMQHIAKDSINNIEDTMKQVSDGFKGDYEWFLRRIREIIGQRLQ